MLQQTGSERSGEWYWLVIEFQAKKAHDQLFSSKKTRDYVLIIQKNLRKERNRQIYINKHLTKLNSDLFAKARHLLREKRIYATWNVETKCLLQKNLICQTVPTSESTSSGWNLICEKNLILSFDLRNGCFWFLFIWSRCLPASILGR